MNEISPVPRRSARRNFAKLLRPPLVEMESESHRPSLPFSLSIHRRFYMQSASDDYTERLKFCDYFRGFAEGGNYAKNPLCRNINCALELGFVCNSLNFKLSCLSRNYIKISISQKAFNTLSFSAYMFLVATKFVSCLYEHTF